MQKPTRGQRQQRIGVEAVEARPDDDQHAGKTDGDRQPSGASATSSPKTSAAPIVTASGSACSTAETLASGRCGERDAGR